MDGRMGFSIEGVPKPNPNEPRRAHVRGASPGYFEAMGLRLVAGRVFDDNDRAGSRSVMIVNEEAARQHFPDGNAVGYRARFNDTDEWSEIVGVIANVRHWGLAVEPRPEAYLCHLQKPTWTVNLVVRANSDPEGLLPAIRERLRGLDRLLPLSRVQTMDELVSRSIASERGILILLAVFASIAVLLTTAGIYGTMAYLLSQKRREIGIRLALGATASDLVRQTVTEGMKLLVLGMVVGIVLSAVLVRLTSASLYGVGLTDPVTYGVVLVLLGAVAWLANYLPARRITRMAPYAVLRQE
jgi:predicted permease